MSDGDKERFPLRSPRSLEALALLVGPSHRAIEVAGIARFGQGGAGDLAFCDREPPAELARIPQGAIVLCTEELAPRLRDRFPGAVFLPLADPRAAFIDLGHQLLEQGEVQVSTAVAGPLGVHPSARISPHAVVHPETRIEEGVRIGAHCVIHRGSWIRAGAVIRDNTVIGVEGINAYRGLDGRQRSFPHFASVIIGEQVEIGASAVVVRGIVNSTRIGHGSVIGNLCNIGHVVDIGDKVWMSVGCLIGGHTTIDNGATLGMGVTVKDNVKIGSGAQLGMGSVVVKSVEAQASVFGNPARFMGAIQAGPER